jgi:flagellar protein FlaG
MDIQMKTGLDSSGNAAEVSRQARPVVQQSAAAVIAQEKAVQPVSSAAVQDQVKNAVENVNRAVQNMAHGSNVEFIVDKDTKINVIKVVDKTTSEVIRQFPSEEILSIAKAIDTLQGLIIRQKA